MVHEGLLAIEGSAPCSERFREHRVSAQHEASEHPAPDSDVPTVGLARRRWQTLESEHPFRAFAAKRGMGRNVEIYRTEARARTRFLEVSETLEALKRTPQFVKPANDGAAAHNREIEQAKIAVRELAPRVVRAKEVVQEERQQSLRVERSVQRTFDRER